MTTGLSVAVALIIPFSKHGHFALEDQPRMYGTVEFGSMVIQAPLIQSSALPSHMLLATPLHWHWHWQMS